MVELVREIAVTAGLWCQYDVTYGVGRTAEGDYVVVSRRDDAGAWGPWDGEQTRRWRTAEEAAESWHERMVFLRAGITTWRNEADRRRQAVLWALRPTMGYAN